MTRPLLTTIAILLSMLTSRAELTVSLLTIDPGNDIYELEGHTELHFNDPDRDLDMTVSWGVFDFSSPGFVYRFVKGETDYMAVGYPYDYFIEKNSADGRRVTSQKLNLLPHEAELLLQLALRNIEPQNRVYRYNYVKDNCATRPLALVEKAIGGTLSHPGDTLTTCTWRSEMARYHANYPWYQFGIDLALGSGIDKRLTAREKCYAPYYLREFIGGATRPDGEPIVTGPNKLIMSGTPDGTPDSPTPWYLTPMFVARILLAMTIMTAWHDIKRRQPTRGLYTLLYGVSTIEGLVLTYLIFVSTHEATSPNWLYLWLNPLCIIGAIGVWLKKHNRVVYFYQIVNFVALIALIVIGATGVQHLNHASYLLIACNLITAGEYIYLNNRCQTKSTSPSKAA